MVPSRTEHISFVSLAVLRRFLKPFLMTLAVVVLLMVVMSSQEFEYRQSIFEQEGLFAVELQQEFISLEFREVQTDLLYLSQQAALKEFLSGDANARSILERDYQNLAESKTVYDQIRCLDETGKEIVRVNYADGQATIVPQDDLQTKTTRYYYQQAMALEEGEIFVSPFDLNVEHGTIERPIKPVIRFLTPVFDESGKKSGLLVLNYLGTHLLSRLKEIGAGFVGQTILVNFHGEYLKAPNPEHDWGWMLGQEESFRLHYPEAWSQVESIDEGQVRVEHGSFAVRRVSPSMRLRPAGFSEGGDPELDESSLLLIVYVPTKLATAESIAILKPIAWVCFGTLVVVSLLSLYGARSSAIRKLQEVSLADSESRLRRLSTLLLAAQEAERRSISRDLHDELGQQLTAITLDLKSAARDNVEPRVGASLQRAVDGTGQLLTSLHEIATRLRPSVLDDLGLRDAVGSYLTEYEKRTGIVVHSDLEFDRRDVPPTAGENAYRILQESLTNVANHAQAKEVWVSIMVEGKNLLISVKDCGVGFDLEQLKDSPRLGILGMQERVELVGGQFDLRSAPGKGAEIEVEIPLDQVDIAQT